MGSRSALFVVSMFLLGASPAAAECKLEKLAEAPVTMDGLRPSISARINGKDASFLLDTGASFSVVSDEAAAQYGMTPSTAPFGATVRAIGGGEALARAVEAQNFQFLGGNFQHLQFLEGGRVGGGDRAGLLGQNLLGIFDVEYDLTNGVVRFFKPVGCEKANLAYWSSGLALQRIPLENPGRFLQPVKSTAKVDGRTVRINFDTGASVSFLNQSAAARIGIRPSSEGVTAAGVTYGVYGKGMETFIAPFASFAIGDEEIRNTRLRVAKIDMPDVDMILGDDFFLSHRIYVARSQSKIYFTYNGGPVFRLDRSPAARQVAQTDPAAPASETPKPAAPAEGPATAAEFARRAAASAARRDFPAAIADYGRAIELEPQNAQNYHARAMARLANRQPVLAMADLDLALKYDPKDLQALTVRGGLYLQAHDAKRAQADFEAAEKLAPANSGLPATVGLAYARAGMFDLAIRQLDGWIAAHPRDENLGQVLGARCWVRALADKELETALADCDQAVRKDRNSVLMTYRGLVLYRMGRTDEALAQYAAAIKAQPRAAMALYLRGLAEEKKGDKTAGDADLAAARAIAPNLAQEYRRFGLAPEGAPAASS